jgi:hypothetical protein
LGNRPVLRGGLRPPGDPHVVFTKNSLCGNKSGSLPSNKVFTRRTRPRERVCDWRGTPRAVAPSKSRSQGGGGTGRTFIRPVPKVWSSAVDAVPGPPKALTMQLDFWGAQPPRLWFGAPRAEQRGVGSH